MKTALFLFAASSLVLSGCSTVATVKTPSQHSYTQSEAAARIGSALLGANADLSDLQSEFGSQVFVDSEYTAASGNTCRRFSNSDKMMRVACRDSSGMWYVQRSLNPEDYASGPRLMSETTMPAVRTMAVLPEPQPLTSVTDEPIEIVSAESANITEDTTLSEMSLGDAETLWSFSARATGSGHNWQQIAELNGIEDVRQLESGQILVVPTQMLRNQ